MFLMKFIMLAVFSVVVCCQICWAADNWEEIKEITVSSSDSLERGLSELIAEICSNQRASPKDCTRLRLFVHQLEKGKLTAANPDERQQIVRDVLGAEHYKDIESVLLAQIKSADPVLRDCAIRTLGKVLYSLSSEDYLKNIVFGPNRQASFFALTSLVAMGTPGANDLLTAMLLSGALTDLMAGDAIEVLTLSDKPTLADNGQAIILANKGPLALKALLPALRLRKDFEEIVATLFRSNIGRVPDEERLTLMDHAKLNLEFALLEEISRNFATYSSDNAVKQKVTDYAKSMAHSQIYTLALLALERSGEDVAYFEQMLEEKPIPKEKIHVLNLIINRIRHGQRLGTSGGGASVVHNFYFSGEEVLKTHPHTSYPGLWCYFGSKYAWALQEKRKGLNWISSIGGSTYGGWGFNDYYWDNDLSTYVPPTNTQAMLSRPFFRPGGSELADLYVPTDTNQTDVGSQYATDHLHFLLAGFIPLRTLPMGANRLTTWPTTRNYNMQHTDVDEGFQNSWPSGRSSTDWYHSDLREVAYLYVYKLFDKFRDLGGLDQP